MEISVDNMKVLLVLFVVLLLVAIFVNDVRKEGFILKWDETPPQQYRSKQYTRMCVGNCVQKINGEWVIWNSCERTCGPFTKADVIQAMKDWPGQQFL